MSTLLLHHHSYLDHLTPLGHPERPDRIRAIDRILENERFQPLAREQAPLGTMEDIARAHPMSYVDALHNMSPEEGLVRLDTDTTMSPGTWEAALRAVGAARAATDVRTIFTRAALLRHCCPGSGEEHYQHTPTASGNHERRA